MSQVSTRPFAFPFPHEVSTRSYDRAPATYASRELVTAAKPTSPERPYDSSSWNLTQGRSPMSEGPRSGEPSPKIGSDQQPRPELPQMASREQLPSLSSLFGNSHPHRPAQSPYSERRSPLFSSQSPHDRTLAAPVHPDRAFESSYQRAPVSSLFAYSSRQETSDRSHFQAPPAPPPSQEPRYSPALPSRTQSAATNNSWSPSEISRSEYFARDTSSSFRSHVDPYHPNPVSTPENERSPTYRNVQSISASTGYPPTPASIAAAEPATTKDGLGPKIWTGTQFLPRFVRQALVPGEGMCYFYDDNTHCKTIIDGEPVNAHWGVTKAGKPRKSPRGGQSSPDTPPAEAEDIAPRPGSARTENERFEVEQREPSHSASPRPSLRRQTPDEEAQLPKRRRTSYTNFALHPPESSPRAVLPETTSPATKKESQPFPKAESPAVHANPFTSAIRLAPELLSLFFQNINQMGYSMFPKLAFQSWALSSSEKSPDDLTLLHSVIACGTVFSSNPEHKRLGREYAATLRSTCNTRSLSFQLVQSRLLLAIYYTAVGSSDDAWDLCGAAIRAAYGLRMNMELDLQTPQSYPYGLNRAGYAECWRRTFWSCYIMDRLDSFASGRSSSIRPDEVFLRLPCNTESFESQYESQTEFFSASELQRPGAPRHGLLSNLIYVSTIWDDIMLDIYRSSHSVVPSARRFDTFYRSSIGNLHNWIDRLPQDMSLSPENLANAARCGALGRFMLVHATYLTASMKLNRYVRESPSVHLQFGSNVQTALSHATELLDMVKWAGAYYTAPENTTKGIEIISPFMAYAIESAIDIRTAKPSMSDVPSFFGTVRGVETILTHLAQIWPGAQQQQETILRRIREVAEVVAILEKGGGNEQELAKFKGLCKNVKNGSFQMIEPLQKNSGNWQEFDLLYS
ncbi:hypothetical protein BP5796_04491 [Coleophoma crateriformis]|uniref:Xylanolytic transcriptional activator regulatory domain-containing protein n=1 Tax=Coleophoma crateriformis TaxID=565419 RepID=A0A3D8S9R6_9HELO|nr:hypothetical protein BP5796_04491 [Coleophoma crateriformis]